MISEEIVTKTWQRIATMTPLEAPLLIQQMQAEQPLVLSFLTQLDDMPFDQNERGIVMYVGTVVWQIMRQSERRLRKVTGNKLRKAEDANLAWIERMETAREADFVGSTQLLLATYPEPEVLRYIIEAIMEESDDPDDIPIRDEYTGLAFLHLKILLDAFIASLAP